MAPIKKKKTQVLKENNEKKKLLMRKLRENIRNDPAKYEEAKRKERERYYARKQAGKIKTINQMSSREQRITRKDWRGRSKRYYNNKKRLKDLEMRLEENSPPASPENTLGLHLNVPVVEDTKTRMGKNRRRKNTRILKNKIKKLEEQLQIAERKAEKYKKRAQRLINKTKVDTPIKKVKNLVKNQNISPQVWKKLLFNEVIIKQMRENVKHKKKHTAEVIAGKIIKKYRMMSTLSKELSYKLRCDRRVKIVERKDKLKMTKYVTAFLEKDECSRLCPGKKDTVTCKKDKRQKRYLNDSLFNLHKTFCLENPHLKISYATFCKVRPFWIVTPRVSERDTCLCVVHENMELLANKLFNNKVIAQSSPRQLCGVLCCEGDHLKEECLQRSCNLCRNNILSILPSTCDENISTISIPQWISKKVVIKVKGKEKTCTKSVKEELKMTKNDSFDMLQKNILKYMLHIRNMRHQQATIRHIRENLKSNEILIHSDFSENYGCKYGREIQSAHFGGSKPQLSLHTVVVYYKLESNDLLTKSFCTVSEDLRHDSFAVCAHLEPVIADMKGIVPNLKSIHFLSDSVVNQYRNKTMFHLIGTHLTKISQVEEIRWHYSESGHGKGAPDGIGGCLKRNADDLVARGHDISSYDHFLLELRKQCPGVEIIPILKKDIDQIVNVIHLETFKGTLKVHEISWSADTSNKLQARSLSCLKCDAATICKHYGIGQIQLVNMDNLMSKKSKLKYEEVYSDSSNDTSSFEMTHENFNLSKESTKPTEMGFSFSDLNVGDWCMVKYVNKLYPGEILKKLSPNLMEISCMAKAGKFWKWPSTPDILNYSIEDIKFKLGSPVLANSRGHYKFE